MNQADLITTVAEHASLTKADAGKAVEAHLRLAARLWRPGTLVDHAGFQAGLQRQCAELRRTFLWNGQ
jgi:nucleoid DNA-binding protein